MADKGRVALWAGAGSVLAVGIAWVLTSGSGQAKLSAHFQAALGSGSGLPVPGQEAPIRTGVTPGKWGPYQHGKGGSRLVRRHPASASPNMTLLQQRGYDWMFCPPSEGDL